MRQTCRACWTLLVAAPLMLVGLGSGGQQTPAVVGKYNGPGGCAAASCHGSVLPKEATRVLQNEYSIWIAQDKHARSFTVLSSPVSLRMARTLGIGRPDQAARCLVCHALYVPPERRAQSFELGDGVSCESCHGPASGWLGPHTIRNWPHEKSVELGMCDLRNYEHRTERCLTCHLGTTEKFVDHEMIAAGHPDLTFELDVFSSQMPRHWKYTQDDSWRLVQAWAVGASVQLREGLQRLARRAASPSWPEYAELDCFACHHSLTSPEESWRQESGYAGRRPGTTPWNQSRNAVLQHLAEEIAAEKANQLSIDMAKLGILVGQADANRSEISAIASHASNLADQLGKRAASQGYDRALTLRLMRRIAQDKTIPVLGERIAEQTAMCLDSLFIAYDQDAKPANRVEVRGAIDALYQQLDRNPSAYSAPRFAAQLKRVGELLEH